MPRLAVGFAALALAFGLAAPIHAVTIISSEYIELPYDYGEFVAASDGKQFKVEIRGHASDAAPAAAAQDAFEARLLQVLQARKPRPALTFVRRLDEPVRPDHRFVLLFNPAPTVSGDRLCRDLANTETVAPTAGRLHVQIAYCRNETVLSHLVVRGDAAGVDDPRLGPIVDQAFAALLPRRNPLNDGTRQRIGWR